MLQLDGPVLVDSFQTNEFSCVAGGKKKSIKVKKLLTVVTYAT